MIGPEPMRYVPLPGVSFCDSELDIERLRVEYERQDWLRLPRLLNADMLAFVQSEIDRAEFEEFDHARAGPVQARELCMIENVAWNVLHFLANDPKLFR